VAGRGLIRAMIERPKRVRSLASKRGLHATWFRTASPVQVARVLARRPIPNDANLAKTRGLAGKGVENGRLASHHNLMHAE
jgi:hypothetical protein